MNVILKDIDDILGRMRPLVEGFSPTHSKQDGQGDEWTPDLDVEEMGGEFVVTAELPGVDPNDVEIDVSPQTLSLRGEKKPSTDRASGQLHRGERCYGRFSRVLSLPATVDPEKVCVTHRNGVVTICLGKSGETGPRAIEIEVEK